MTQIPTPFDELIAAARHRQENLEEFFDDLRAMLDGGGEIVVQSVIDDITESLIRARSRVVALEAIAERWRRGPETAGVQR